MFAWNKPARRFISASRTTDRERQPVPTYSLWESDFRQRATGSGCSTGMPTASRPGIVGRGLPSTSRCRTGARRWPPCRHRSHPSSAKLAPALPLRPLVRSALVRVLIVDDEAPARAKMRRYVAEYPDIEIVGEAETGVEAVCRIAELQPELVVLDVRMPALDGFGVIDAIGAESMPHVVFVTAFDEYALKAFEVRALDYLLKPFTPQRFAAVIDRARAEIARASGDDTAALHTKLQALLSAVATGRPRYLQRILVHHANRALLLPVDRIDRVEADRNYVRLHSGGTAFTLRGSLTALVERLDPEKFLRINRSEIVRLDAVKELQPWFHGDYRVVMGDGTTLMWSRRYRAQKAGEFGDV